MNSHDILRPGSAQVRRLWARFFEARGHKHIPSSSLIPVGDPTLLFTTAGMVQMKPYFVGLADPPARRLTSIQKCLRTSDIDAVGNERNQTFFEMLGNFSVGDYFKDEVIPWAWELVTTPWPEGLGLEKGRIWATIYLDDEESFELWRKVGIPAERIRRFGEKENFWFAGPVGPCGPNTEINYDFGADKGCLRPDCGPNCENPMPDGRGECDRFLEFWNLVFMTLYQAEDGTRTPLPQKNVDTGAGLERWATLLLWQQGIDSQGRPKRWERRPTNYDTDLFGPVLETIGASIGKSYDEADGQEQRAMRIIADHARAATFLIAEGLTPSNEGRGYVLRRLIRRATTYGQKLKPEVQFLGEAAEAVINQMKGEHPLLADQRGFILQAVRGEANRFFETLERGTQILEGMLSYRSMHGGAIPPLLVSLSSLPSVSADNAGHILQAHGFVAYHAGSSPAQQVGEELAAEEISKRLYDGLEATEREERFEERYFSALKTWPRELSAREIFYLADTCGFPPELTRELAGERGVKSDLQGFERELEAQRERSRAAARFEGDAERIQAYAGLGLEPTTFLGYEMLKATGTVVAIVADGRAVTAIEATETHGATIEVVLDRTPFYAEGGGQVGDKGELVWAFEGGQDRPGGRLVVDDTQAVGEGGVIAHIGRLVEGRLSLGAEVEARVDEDLRSDTMRNHTATHILHAALRQTLGSHVRQAGSYVGPDRLRFDFTHLEALTPEEIAEVEVLANKVVRSNIEVHVHQERYEDAIAGGALAFFGDKYAETVRVVGICEPEAERCFSKELCGGTHCHASGEVGAVVITAETSIGAGMRRIEAVTGRAAVERLRRNEETLAGVAVMLRASPGEIGSRIEALQDEAESLRKRVQALERRSAHDEASDLAAQAKMVGGVAVLAARVAASNADYLRDLGDGLKSKLGSAVILLGAEIGGRPTFLAMSTPDVAKRVPAGDVVRAASTVAGGGGGGRPELAQGGGSDLSKLDAALQAGAELAQEKLKA